jgi:hypothetical protein
MSLPSTFYMTCGHGTGSLDATGRTLDRSVFDYSCALQAALLLKALAELLDKMLCFEQAFERSMCPCLLTVTQR